MVADLHMHSIYSDGSFKPEELVSLAREKGINTIALADHDTVEGVDQALIAGNEMGINVIPAIELSTFKEKAEIHILGYFIDHKNKTLLAKISKIFSARLNRAREMIGLLNGLGIEISYMQVRQIAGDNYVGRPHIARAMVEKGYIKEMKDAFTDKYIGNNGRAYVPKYRLAPANAVELIHEAGGIAVLAHPVFINHGEPLKKDDIVQLQGSGLQGLEVYHSKQSREDSKYYLQVARELGLLVTGGSDFHGENSPDVELGDILLEDTYVDRLRELNGKKEEF